MTKLSFHRFRDAVQEAFAATGETLPARPFEEDFEARRIDVEMTPAGAKILFWIARMAVAFDEFPDRIRILPGADLNRAVDGDRGDGYRLYAVKEQPRGIWRLDGAVGMLDDRDIGFVVEQVLEGLGLPRFAGSRRMLLEAIGYPEIPDVDTMDDIVSVLPRHVAQMLHLLPDAVFGDSWKVEREVALERHARWCHQLEIADVNIDGTLPNKRTLLMQATTMDPYVFDGLLLAEADISKSRDKRTVFDFALQYDESDGPNDSILASALTAYRKAGIEPKTGDGRNALRHLISRHLPGRLDGGIDRAVKLLLENGIDPLAQDKDGLDFDGALQEYRDRIAAPGTSADQSRYALGQLETLESTLTPLWRSLSPTA